MKKGSVRIIVGTQWGDEGKGKIVDLLARIFAIVARYQGGANAGHTVEIGEQKSVLHLIPSGIFHPDVICVLGNGVVIDAEAFFQEATMLQAMGVNLQNRVFISSEAHLLLPWHKLLDGAQENSTDKKIGTTGRGIGPAYVFKYRRIGVRAGDIFHPEYLAAMLRTSLGVANRELNSLRAATVPMEVRLAHEASLKALQPYICDTVNLLNSAIAQGKNVLLEGAQASGLDVDSGTYPYVTSSNPTAGGACVGTGVPPTSITSVLGVCKAYNTRVGNGPFPTEITGSLADAIRKFGNEFGATTGRPRKIGWLDAVQLKRAIQISGVSGLVMTKADVLDGLSDVAICTGYMYKGELLTEYPTNAEILAACTPQYAWFKGWNGVAGCTSEVDLPRRFRVYLDAVYQLTGIPVVIVSTGPKREQTIIRNIPVPELNWLQDVNVN